MPVGYHPAQLDPTYIANTLIVAHYLPDTILDALLSIHLHSLEPRGTPLQGQKRDLWLTEPVAKLTDDRDISSNSLGCLDIIFWVIDIPEDKSPVCKHNTRLWTIIYE